MCVRAAEPGGEPRAADSAVGAVSEEAENMVEGLEAEAVLPFGFDAGGDCQVKGGGAEASADEGTDTCKPPLTKLELLDELCRLAVPLTL